MNVGEVPIISGYILGFIGGLFLLPYVDTSARFTNFPPSVLYASSGGTARFVWDYHVDNRLWEFKSESPVWYFLNQATRRESIIGADNRRINNWSFVINRATCPPRLISPDRVSRQSTATLVIYGVTNADNGIYKCSLQLKAGNPIGHQVQLVVTVRPTFLSSHPNNTYHIIEGEDLEINCTAIGLPTPNITWVNITDGSVLTKSQGSGSAVLRVGDIRRYNSGVYECHAKNNPNEAATTTRTSVTVYYKPVIRTLIYTKSRHSWSGNMMILKCIVDGFPQPHVTWYKPNGQQVSCGVMTLTEGSQVTVRTTECGEDYGFYKCQAVNIAGKDEHFIRVSQLFQPGPPKFTILDHDIRASSVNVRWTKPGYDGGSPVIDYKIQINTIPPQEKVATGTHTYFYGLTKNTSYTIKVVAINVVGSGNISEVTITTKKQGKPTIPKLMVVLYTSRDSKLSVVLRWTMPNDNGGRITKYTIYMKEVQTQWEKIADIFDPSQLQYTATNNIDDGKSYVFMVTAWNKYGESARDDASVKTVNTTEDRAIMETGTRIDGNKIEKSKYDTVVGVITSLLVLSLCLNVLLFVFLWRKTNKRVTNDQGNTTRTRKKGQSYEKNIEMSGNILPQVTQPVSEYEAVQQGIGNTSAPGTVFPSSGDASQYQELNLLAQGSPLEGLGPTYEPLRAKSKDLESVAQHEQHPYESLDLKNKSSAYQSLQTINI